LRSLSHSVYDVTVAVVTLAIEVTLAA
jgi:hypothetical protein